MGVKAVKNGVILYATSRMTTEFSSFSQCLLRWAAAVLLTVAVTLSSVASASQVVAIGEVEVEATGEAAYKEAMRITLVRLTGRRSAVDDPVFEPLIREARRYVQIVRPPTSGSAARITLDAVAIERAMQGLDQPVWSRERPLVLGVVTAAPSGADPAQVRASLERAASERGLPLRLSPATSVGLVPGRTVSAEAALDAARRGGAEMALIGEADGTEWQWTLFDGSTATVFQGSVTVGIEGAADVLALNSLAAVAQPVLETELRVGGVLSLKDYAEVRRMLIALPNVKSAELVAAEGEGALYRIEVAGGAAGLVEALASQPRLRREPGRELPLRYRYGR
jgi:hypothetical protein